MSTEITIRRPLHSISLDKHLTSEIPYVDQLGIRYLPASEHNLEQHIFYLPFDDALVGNTKLNALHGGAVAGFMESAALLHLLLDHSEASRLPKTIDFNIDYVRSAGPRDSFASCTVEKLGRRVALVHMRCWQRHFDRPVAMARAHYLWEELPLDSELTESMSG